MKPVSSVFRTPAAPWIDLAFNAASRPALQRAMRGLCGACLIASAAAVLAACGGSDDEEVRQLPAGTRQQIDTTVQAQMTAGNLPGVVVHVEIPGEGVYTRAYGQANLDTGLERNVDDPFRIASITKTFTATAILQLVDAGRIALTDTVSKWYPAFPNGDRITIDHLLRMRSGIADSADDEFLAEYYDDPFTTLTADQMIERAAALGAEFVAPDQSTVYTNVNFMLLERIAVRVDGRPLDAQLAERVYRRVGMSQTVYPTSTQTALPGGTRGYSYDSTARAFVDKTDLNPEPAGGAGAMISSLRDLARYARAMCTDSGLVSRSTYQARVQGQTLAGEPDFIRYGAGVELLGQFCGHNGTIMGFSSEMFYLPARDAVIVVNVNRLDIDDRSQSTELFLLLSKLLFPQEVDW